MRWVAEEVWTEAILIRFCTNVGKRVYCLICLLFCVSVMAAKLKSVFFKKNLNLDHCMNISLSFINKNVEKLSNAAAFLSASWAFWSLGRTLVPGAGNGLPSLQSDWSCYSAAHIHIVILVWNERGNIRLSRYSLIKDPEAEKHKYESYFPLTWNGRHCCPDELVHVERLSSTVKVRLPWPAPPREMFLCLWKV